jgi:predicted MPP superfamily phosphohydrolase
MLRVGTMGIGSIFNTNNVEISRRRLVLTRKKLHRPVKLAHLSDWHGKRFPQGSNYISGLLEAENPDLVLITGDLLHAGQQIGRLKKELASIGGRFTCYYVHGNNEHYHGLCDQVERCLVECGIVILTNRSKVFRGLRIVGVDDAIEGRPDTMAAFRLVRPGEPVVLMSHSPVLLSRLRQEERHFDLFICGHTHGGQICLPGGVPLAIDSPGVKRKHGSGWHRVGKGQMLVNRGLGEHFVNLRVFCPPELAIVSLR